MKRLYAATGESVVALAEHDGVWHAEPVVRRAGLACVAIDLRAPERLLAGGRGAGLWQSDDGGATWRATGPEETDVFSVAISPVDGTLYAGYEPSMLFRSDDGGATWSELAALRRIPSAPTWSFPPRPWTSHVRWISPSPHDGALLLVGIELGGLMRSDDGGASWSDHAAGAQRDVHALAWHPRAAGRAYEAGGGGAAWSADGGVSWQAADEGRDRHYTWALAVDPDDPDCWYVSASTGPFAAHGRRHAEARVYRWRGDGPWRPLDGGLPPVLESMPYALAFVGARLFAGLADGRLYASDDGGDRWQLLELDGARPGSIVALAGADVR
jgi:photosystem II stability/assembly factor-like uncharacterized protein